jgi:SAM-dependent methyltransferase
VDAEPRSRSTTSGAEARVVALRYGPLVADEHELRLLGTVAGRRILVLGCGDGSAPIELAAAGARVIAVDPSADAVAVTRRAGSARRVAVDVQARDLAELAFVRAETIDVAVSISALEGVADLLRVFRQIHRVLRVEGAVVLAVPHPALACLAILPGGGPDDLQVVRPYGTSSTGAPAHTIEALITALTRAGFRLETLLELMARRPATMADAASTEDTTGRAAPAESGPSAWQPLLGRLPTTLVLRARKTGL